MYQSTTFQGFQDISRVAPCSTKQRIKCLAQVQNTMPLVRLKPVTPQSQREHSTTKPLPISSLKLAGGIVRPVKRGWAVLRKDTPMDISISKSVRQCIYSPVKRFTAVHLYIYQL